MIIKNSEEKYKFIIDFINTIKRIDTEQISNKESLESAVQKFTHKSDIIWYKHLKCINITKHFKV